MPCQLYALFLRLQDGSEHEGYGGKYPGEYITFGGRWTFILSFDECTSANPAAQAASQAVQVQELQSCIPNFSGCH